MENYVSKRGLSSVSIAVFTFYDYVQFEGQGSTFDLAPIMCNDSTNSIFGEF